MKSDKITKKIISEISNFEIVEPSNKLAQEDTLQWLKASHVRSSPEQERIIDVLIKKYAVKPTQIATRFFELDDVLNQNWDSMKVFNITGTGQDIGVRNEIFLEKSEKVFAKFYPAQSLAPDHIIHVTCTGYISPSAPQKLVTQKNWSPATGITHAYHMGCYASLPAVRLAQGLVAARSAVEQSSKIDVVHTEMCGLHMNPMDNTPEQMIVQSLFADGHIKYTLTEPGQNKIGFSMLACQEQLVADSSEDMSWIPSAWGMKMSLSREVPGKIKSSIMPFLENLAQQIPGCSLEQLLKEAHFAIHPGGPKIISSLQETLELQDDQIANSKKILLQRGNMSSATLPHIWKDLLENNYQSGKLVVSLAFGPGLTIFGSIFRMI